MAAVVDAVPPATTRPLYLVVECFTTRGVRVCGRETIDGLRLPLLAAFAQNCPRVLKAVDERGWFCAIYVSVARAINICQKFGWRLLTIYGTRSVFPNIKVSGFPRNELGYADCLVFTKHVPVDPVPVSEIETFVDSFTVPESAYRSLIKSPNASWMAPHKSPKLSRYDRRRSFRRSASVDPSSVSDVPQSGPPTGGAGPVFGVALSELSLSTNGVPLILEELVGFLNRSACLETEGLFRISASLTEVQAVRQRIDAGEYVDFAKINDAHLAANLIKVFLKSLPEPLIPTSLFDFINTIPDMPEVEDKLRAVQWLVQNYISEPQYSIIKFLLEYLSTLSKHSKVNKMTAGNLAIIFGPNLAWSRDDPLGGAAFGAMRGLNVMLQLMINNYTRIFESDAVVFERPQRAGASATRGRSIFDSVRHSVLLTGFDSGASFSESDGMLTPPTLDDIVDAASVDDADVAEMAAEAEAVALDDDEGDDGLYDFYSDDVVGEAAAADDHVAQTAEASYDE